MSPRTPPPARTQTNVFGQPAAAAGAATIAGLLGPAASTGQSAAAADQSPAATGPATAQPAEATGEAARKAALAKQAAAEAAERDEAERAETARRREAAEREAAERQKAAEREEAANRDEAERAEAARRREAAEREAAEREAAERRELELAAAERREIARVADVQAAADLVVSRGTDRGEQRDLAVLSARLEYAVASADDGVTPTPLEVPPHLRSRVAEEVARAKKRGERSTMTVVLLQAIGAAHVSGALAHRVRAYQEGQKHQVPLFGTVTVGTAPRGNTVRLQFTPPARDRAVIDVLSSWYGVPMVVLVRLALEERYQRARKVRGESKLADDNDGGTQGAAESSSTQVTE